MALTPHLVHIPQYHNIAISCHDIDISILTKKYRDSPVHQCILAALAPTVVWQFFERNKDKCLYKSEKLHSL